MTDAPLWTQEICPRCNADRQALFALAKAQGRRSAVGAILRARNLIRACPFCAAAWEKEKDRG